MKRLALLLVLILLVLGCETQYEPKGYLDSVEKSPSWYGRHRGDFGEQLEVPYKLYLFRVQTSKRSGYWILTGKVGEQPIFEKYFSKDNARMARMAHIVCSRKKG